jgi:hypothetical protein
VKGVGQEARVVGEPAAAGPSPVYGAVEFVPIIVIGRGATRGRS